ACTRRRRSSWSTASRVILSEAKDRAGDACEVRGSLAFLTRSFAEFTLSAANGLRMTHTLAPSRCAALPSRPMLPSQLAVTPPGALDLTGEAARRRRLLQRAAMQVLERAEYEELIPPTLEYQETFLRAGGPGVAERLIRFPDRDGRILALRYDFTASLARVAATTFAGTDRPLRLSYSGTVYRQEPERGGRPREMLQV